MKIIQEHVVLSDKNPFLTSIFNEPDLSYPIHHHRNAYELTMTLGLSGIRMVGDNTEQFTDKDLVLIAPGLPHCWQDHGIRERKDNKVVVVQFSEMLIPDILRSSTPFQQIDFALTNAKYGLEIFGESKKKALSIMESFSVSQGFDTYLGILKVLQLFGQKNAVRKLCSDGYIQPDLKYETGRLEKVLQCIQDNYSRKLSIENVAAEIHMSPSAFSHYFKKRTLKSFTDYVVELRLGKAAQLLQFTDIPVSVVCYESGFQNISHFNATFNRKYKLSPLKFRKLKLIDRIQ